MTRENFALPNAAKRFAVVGGRLFLLNHNACRSPSDDNNAIQIGHDHIARSRKRVRRHNIERSSALRLTFAVLFAVVVKRCRFVFDHCLQMHGASPELVNVFERLARVFQIEFRALVTMAQI